MILFIIHDSAFIIFPFFSRFPLRSNSVIIASLVDGGNMRKGGRATDGMRIGIGHDTHRLKPGGPLKLGGVVIPHDRELIGHSDGDVLLHAITDALLGAAALGDIGQMFPDTDPAHHGRDSAEMLRIALDAVATLGLQIVNLDCIVFAQRPKLLPHRIALRERIAEILEIESERVGLQAKTGEGIGPVGHEEVIDAQCVVLMEFYENKK
jgi:2-C-methyl-D-erythritol 2,4-cyclodiphosphate synthase